MKAPNFDKVLLTFYNGIKELTTSSSFLKYLINKDFISSSEFFLNEKYFGVDFEANKGVGDNTNYLKDFFFGKSKKRESLIDDSYKEFMNQDDYYNVFKDTREIFVILDKLNELTKEANAEGGADKVRINIFQKLEDEVRLFIKIYEIWLSKYNLQADFIGPTILQTVKLSSALRITIEMCNKLTNKDYEKYEVAEDLNRSRLTVFIDSKMSLEVFTEKMVAVNSIYTELCYLFDVSIENYPLESVKLDSANQTIDLNGNPQIINLMTNLIERGIGYLHQTYIQEGEITEIPNDLSRVEQIFQLTGRFEAEKLNLNKGGDALQKFAEDMALNLNKIFLNESRIVVNEKEFSIYKELRQKFLIKGKSDSEIES